MESALRSRPERPMPCCRAPNVTSLTYRSVTKLYSNRPSLTSPATAVISSPTPATKILGFPNGFGPDRRPAS